MVAQVPNDNSVSAVFGEIIPTPQTVYMNVDVTTRSITFDHDVTYVVGGFGTIHLESGSAAEGIHAGLAVVQESHQSQAEVSINRPTDVDVGIGSTLIFHNTLELNGNVLTKTGEGEIAFRNDLLTSGGTLNCSQGTCNGSGTISGDLNNDGGTLSPGNSDSASVVPKPATWMLLTLATSALMWSVQRSRPWRWGPVGPPSLAIPRSLPHFSTQHVTAGRI